ncbi:MAG: homoserine kinase [Acidobacteriaceae bacterium]|nr:homoserine kinase [Acidobacteriaceae bacterium]
MTDDALPWETEPAEIHVPASIANLGPGFDTLAVAVNLYLSLVVERRDSMDEISFDFIGCDPTGDNLIHEAFNHLRHEYGRPLPSIHVEVRSQIPPRSGLGSSAAATVAGLRLFELVSGVSLGPTPLLAVAAALEGHADNVAAAMLGGLTVSCQAEDGTVTAVSLPWPPAIRMLVLTPDYALTTERAREVLPSHVPFRDAVSNMQRLALLLCSLEGGHPQSLREAMVDKLHQPYRKQIVPGLAALLELEHPDLLGVCLSGAGPSLLALTLGESRDVQYLVEESYSRTGNTFTMRWLKGEQPFP